MNINWDITPGADAGIGTLLIELLNKERAEKRGREAQRFKNLYAPLRALFLKRHVIVVTGVGAPYLRRRLANAIYVFQHEKTPSAAVKAAFGTLFDKQRTTSAEIEFGGDFPLSRIMSIVQQNAECADYNLLMLIAKADHARYEQGHADGQMTQADLQLFEYICKEHARLSKKYA